MKEATVQARKEVRAGPVTCWVVGNKKANAKCDR